MQSYNAVYNTSIFYKSYNAIINNVNKDYTKKIILKSKRYGTYN